MAHLVMEIEFLVQTSKIQKVALTILSRSKGGTTKWMIYFRVTEW